MKIGENILITDKSHPHNGCTGVIVALKEKIGIVFLPPMDKVKCDRHEMEFYIKSGDYKILKTV